VEGEHRRGERNRRQTGSMYTPAYRVLVSSEFQLHPPAEKPGSCVRAGRRHGPLNAKCWSPQSSERAASSPGRQGSRARASSRQGSPGPTLRPCTRAPTPAPWGCRHPLPPRRVRAPRPQIRRLPAVRGCHAASVKTVWSRSFLLSHLTPAGRQILYLPADIVP